MNRSIGLLLPPGFQVLDLVASTVFELANGFTAEEGYAFSLVSEQGGIVTSSSGIGVLTVAPGGDGYDTLLVAGQTVPATPSPPGLPAMLRRTAEQVWGQRPALDVDRTSFHDEVRERAAQLALSDARLRAYDGLVDRLAIEAALTSRGLLKCERGGWC